MRMPPGLIRRFVSILILRRHVSPWERRLGAALTEVKDALQIRPEDKEALDLRDKIQTAVDKAEVEQHQQKAESAITDEDFSRRS